MILLNNYNVHHLVLHHLVNIMNNLLTLLPHYQIVSV